MIKHTYVGAVHDGFAPHPAALVFVGPDTELVLSVGFEVVDHGVAGGAGLIDPLPVPLSVTDCVEPERGNSNTIHKKYNIYCLLQKDIYLYI